MVWKLSEKNVLYKRFVVYDDAVEVCVRILNFNLFSLLRDVQFIWYEIGNGMLLSVTFFCSYECLYSVIEEVWPYTTF